MIIRRSKPADARRISLLRRRSIRELNSDDYNEVTIEFLVEKNNLKNTLRKIKNEELFCLFDGSKLVGTISLKDNVLKGLYIDPRYLKKGYGKKLIEFIEDHTMKKGVKRVKLYSTLYAYKFYLKMDYRLVKWITWTKPEFSIKVPIMEKKL